MTINRATSPDTVADTAVTILRSSAFTTEIGLLNTALGTTWITEPQDRHIEIAQDDRHPPTGYPHIRISYSQPATRLQYVRAQETILWDLNLVASIREDEIKSGVEDTKSHTGSKRASRLAHAAWNTLNTRSTGLWGSEGVMGLVIDKQDTVEIVSDPSIWSFQIVVKITQRAMDVF